VANLLNMLKFYGTYKERGAQIIAKPHWLKVGDMPTMAFFKVIASKEVLENIKALKIKYGRNIDDMNIEKEFVNHYKSISHSQGMRKERKVTMLTYIDVVLRKHTQEQQNVCDQGITLDELMTPFEEMVNDKSTGKDIFPCEIYKVA
jgi:hypothetical protein